MASPRPSTALRQLQSCASASVLGVANFRVVRLTAASAAYRRHASTSVFIKIASYNVRLDFRLPPFASVFQGTKSPEKSMVLAGHANSSSHSPFGLSLSAAAEEDDPMRWDGLLNAVPKKKVSHSRKSMRSANKGLKDRVDFIHCPGCGKPKLAHHICASCFGDIARRQKAKMRAKAQCKESTETVRLPPATAESAASSGPVPPSSSDQTADSTSTRL